MQIGQPDDPRKFQKEKGKPTGVTKDIVDKPTKLVKCVVCKLEILGKAYRVAEGKYVCFRCNNE